MPEANVVEWIHGKYVALVGELDERGRRCWAAADVSLDQLVRAFAAVGGRIVVKVAAAKPKKGKSAKKPSQGTLIVEAFASR